MTAKPPQRAIDAPPLPGVARTAADFADVLLPVVLAAGRTQLRYYRQGVAIETKADKTPVTIADQEAEAAILTDLARLCPDVPVVAEEAMAAGNRPPPADVFLLVDPLDGTREFIGGHGDFTINIALVANGVPIFGIVYAPALDDLFVTVAPDLAVRARLAPGSTATSLAETGAHPISARKADPHHVTALVSRSHMTAETEALLSPYRVTTRRAAGSSLKFCLIAAGEADIYPRAGRTSEWDTAAGDAIVRAAGGMVTTPDGRPLRYGKADADYRNPDYIAWGRGLRPGA